MKTLLTIFFSVALCIVGTAQTIRRVNNNLGISGTNVYSTFAAAQTAAAANDIIILEPNTVSHGDILVTKPLKIYGNGYFLTTNTELKADTRSSILGTVEFNTGSGGSEMYGVTVTTAILVYGVSNITISRNHIYNPNTGNTHITLLTQNKAGTTNNPVTNIFITRNWVVLILTTVTAGFNISNVLVNNNIMAYVTANNDPGIQSWVVRNNTFYSSSNNFSLVNSVLENNFFMAGGSAPSLTNVISSYNISTGATFASEVNGNKNNYVLAPIDEAGQPVSELVGAGTGISLDETLQIKAGSQLKTLGSSGSEVGAYGGGAANTYIVSGIPAIPSVVNMVHSGTGDNTTPVKVTITVKSNN